MGIEEVWAAIGPVLTGVVAGLLLLWLALLLALRRSCPGNLQVADTLRLLPDVIRLLRRLAADPELPRGVRVHLILLLVYLAIPIDLVPDFIPVIGYADDAIIVVLVLRSVTRRVGPEALDKHWSGTPDGLAAVRRMSKLPATRT
ncbi:YkvA family protein [Antrihabitans cavernicola]|uniref:DUF1232 domain-containing protein n=1 Tax=Antrihabitans cavernicola TaxID=2495913 RepID=A0A5A7S4N6_9NOCA|nr:DUF1232 domain-containing protein [Spelaeibacter cavernicola]KAA0015869.1 DUF1232 domain-containing protein [Spelaeibacter cavernicola]